MHPVRAEDTLFNNPGRPYVTIIPVLIFGTVGGVDPAILAISYPEEVPAAMASVLSR